MELSLIKINNNNLHILKNLFQLYIHDISKELSWNVNNNGLFEAYSLDCLLYTSPSPRDCS